MFKLEPKINALLLASSPYHANRDFLSGEATAFQKIFDVSKRILFLPFALKNHRDYTAFNQKLLTKFDCEVVSLCEHKTNQDKQKAIEDSDGIFIGGGNTFRLLAALHELNIFEALRKKIVAGTPYLGTSAGATLFCPTIKTTNDMPIVNVPNLKAFDFLPFQINPHFPESETDDVAESRSDRLHEFHEENTSPIVALREGGFLTLKNGKLALGGEKSAVLFQKDTPKFEFDNIKHLICKLHLNTSN